MSRHILKTSILIVLSATSCSAPDGVANETPEPPATSREKRTLPETSKHPTVQVLVDKATADLIGRLEQQKIDAADVSTLQAEEVMWRSSAAGCPKPDRGYMMVLTPGVLIRLRAAGQVYEYHSTLRGPPFLCEPPARIETPAPRDSSLDPT
jgi:hypothetical protein